MEKLSLSFILSNLVSLSVRFLGVILIFLTSIILTNNFNPKIVGQYDLIRNFVLFAGTLCNIGAELSIYYFAGKVSFYIFKNIYTKFISIVFTFSIFLIILVLFLKIGSLYKFITDDNLYFLVLKTSLFVFFFSTTNINLEVLRINKNSFLSEIFKNIFKNIPILIGLLVIIYFNKEFNIIDFFLYGSIFINLLSFLFVYLSFKNNNDLSILPQDTSVFYTYKGIITQSYPMGISHLIFFILNFMDIFIIQMYYGLEYVAYYGIGVKIMVIISVINVTINTSSSQNYSKYYHQKDFVKLKSLIRKNTYLILFLNIPIIVLIILMSDEIIELFGKNYVEHSKYPMIIMLLGQGICSFFGTIPYYMNMTGKQKILKNILIVTVFLNFTLNIILIPLFNIYGASISFVISVFFWNFTSVYFAYKKDNFLVTI